MVQVMEECKELQLRNAEELKELQLKKAFIKDLNHVT